MSQTQVTRRVCHAAATSPGAAYTRPDVDIPRSPIPLAAAHAAPPPDPATLPRPSAGARFVAHDRLAEPFVVVDGRVGGGAVLELSHWPGCATPHAFAAVTATGIVDRYLRHGAAGPEVGAVTNNHYDVDGILSAWLLLAAPPAEAPERALALAAAEAGDFATWTDPWALRAAITLVGLAERHSTPLGAVRAALAPGVVRDPAGPLQEAVLPRVGRVLRDPERFAFLWGPTWEAIAAERALAEAGEVVLVEHPELDLAVVRAPRPLSRPAVCPLTEASRILTVTPDGTAVLEQRYETWVAFSARPLPPRADLTAAARELTSRDPAGAEWAFEGLAQSTPRLMVRGPAGRPGRSGLDEAAILDAVAPHLDAAAPSSPSATLRSTSPRPIGGALSDTDDARATVRRLLLSGDNILKNRDDSTRWERAAARYRDARDTARRAGLDDLLPIVEVRLADVEERSRDD